MIVNLKQFLPTHLFLINVAKPNPNIKDNIALPVSVRNNFVKSNILYIIKI